MAWVLEDETPQPAAPKAGRWVLEDAPVEDPSLLQQAGRQAGLLTRVGIKALLGLPNMVGNAVGGLYNAGADVVQGQGKGYRVQDFNQRLENNLNWVGLPEPANSAERIGSDVSEALAGVAFGGGIGKVMQEGGEAAKTIGKFLMDNLPLQLKAAGAGAGAAGITRENGGSAEQQTAAGLAAAVLAPSVYPGLGDAAKLVIRGRDKNLPRLQENLRNFENAGTTPTVGQLTERPTIRAVESLQAKTPGAVTIMQGKATNQAAEINRKVNDIIDNTAARLGPANAGAAITEGLSKSFVPNIKATQKTLYDALDNFLPSDSMVPATNFGAKLSILGGGIKGARNLSESTLLRNPTVAGLLEGFTQDVQNGALPYQALKEIRSRIGDKLEDFTLTSDVPKSQLKQLYSALSADMRLAAEEAGSEALSAFDRANKLTRAFHNRIDTIEKAIGKGEREQVFRSLLSGNLGKLGGATEINAVMKSLPIESRKIVSATFLENIGKALPGKQNAEGTMFSPETFLTNWAKTPDDVKRAMFNDFTVGQQYTKDLNSIAKVASNLRDGSKFLSNPGGTGSISAAVGATSGIVGTASSGNFGATAGIISLIAANNQLAKRAMTNPRFVRFLATNLNKPASTIPAQVNAFREYASKSKDPEAIEIANALLAD